MTDKAFYEQTKGLVGQINAPVVVKRIVAGKFRRYVHMSRLKQLLTPSIVIPNCLDVINVGIGTVQSLLWLIRHRPDVIFMKGGYVCLPIGYAARLLRIPMVLHDSDSRPGLTNRLLSRWASAIVTGFPVENYTYPRSITQYAGVPIGAAFVPYSRERQMAAKRSLGVAPDQFLVVSTGGSLGAKSINDAMVEAAPALLSAGIALYQVTGKLHYDTVSAIKQDDARYTVVPFVYATMADVLGAADVVVARGSATFLQELAGIGKPVIIVPAKQLGDQQKNARVYQDAGAGIIMNDDELNGETLTRAVLDLFHDQTKRTALAEALHQFAKPEAAKQTARAIAAAALSTRQRP